MGRKENLYNNNCLAIRLPERKYSNRIQQNLEFYV